MAQPSPIKSDVKSSDPEIKDIYAILDILKADMKELTKTVGDVGKVEASRAVKSAKDKAHDVKAAGEEHFDALRDTAEGYGRATGEYIRQNPVAAVGIAAGLGLVVGLLMSPRR